MPKGQELPFRSTLDDSDFEAKMRRMEATGKRVAGAVSGQLKGLASPILALGPAIAAAFTGKAILSGVTQVFSAGRALRVLSRETGAGVAGLVILQSKFKQAGLDGDMVGTSIFRLQKSIAGIEDDENKGGAGAIASLGLNLAQLRRLSPDQQLLRVGDAISRIRAPAERTAAAMQIFGRSGAQLGAVFNRPGFAEIAPGLQQKANLMARNAETFERISIKLERVGGILKTFYAGTADKLGAGLEPLLDQLESVNLVSAGQQFGESLSEGARALEPVVKTLVSGIPTMVSFLTDGLDAIGSMLGDDARILTALHKEFTVDGDDARIIAALDKAVGPRSQGEFEKQQAIVAQKKRVQESETNVKTGEDRLNDPLQQWSQEIVQQNKAALAKDARQLVTDREALDRLESSQSGRDKFAAVVDQMASIANSVVIKPKSGTALDSTSWDIADREGRRYTGPKIAEANILSGTSGWDSKYGFGNTGIVATGLGMGAYGRTGSIWSHSRGRSNDHMANLAKHAQETAKNTRDLVTGLKGSGSGAGGNGGPTVAN